MSWFSSPYRMHYSSCALIYGDSARRSLSLVKGEKKENVATLPPSRPIRSRLAQKPQNQNWSNMFNGRWKKNLANRKKKKKVFQI